MIIQKIRNITFCILFAAQGACCVPVQGMQQDQKELNKNLIDAVYAGNFSNSYNALRRGADPDCRDTLTIDTPLAIAIQTNNLDIVDLLLIKNANPNLVSSLDLPPLALAIIAPYSEKKRATLVHTLIFYRERPASVNAQGRNGWTALHYASATRSLLVIEYLLSEEADTTIQNFNGQTADEITDDPKINALIRQARKNQVK